MREAWYIANAKYPQTSAVAFETNLETAGMLMEDDITFYIDGYILPRLAWHQDLKQFNQKDLVTALYRKHGKDFTTYIKGVFCIVVLTPRGFQVFTDRHSVNNFLVYRSGRDFMISNSIDLIANSFNLEPDFENAALFTLLSHFIDGTTQFKNLSSSTPAEFLEFDGDSLKSDNYWKPSDLFKPSRTIENGSYQHYAEIWKSLASQYIEYLKPSGVSLTLTAGNDSRMVLSALLSTGITPHTFTFGNPDSYESVVSKRVAKAAGVEHCVHYANEPSPSWMDGRANAIVQMGNSIISVQRSHRYDAYEIESISQPRCNMIFTGLMGGEYVKKPAADSAALHPLLSHASQCSSLAELSHIISKSLKCKGFNVSVVETDEISRRLMSFVAHAKGMNKLEQSFIFLYLFYGCSHHTQDSRILGHFFSYPVNLFMDIDFLEMLAGSNRWYINSPRAYNRLTHSEFLVSITHILAPQLSSVPYGKRGQYTAEDLLNHRFAFILKRLKYIFYNEKKNYPPGFSLGKWMVEYSRDQLLSLEPVLGSMFDTQYLGNKLDELEPNTGEYKWQLLTNPINLGLNYNRYGKI